MVASTIPALSSNRYVLHAYGVALDGSQPPADGSLDDNVAFRASGTATCASRFGIRFVTKNKTKRAALNRVRRFFG